MIEPVGYDKAGPKYTRRSVNDLCLKMINSEQYFEKRAKRMTADIDKATNLTEQAISNFDCVLERMMKAEARVAEETKKVSGKIRATTQNLSDGLAKIERQANFDRLERYVELLERANSALTSLAELEKTGKLEKIAAAVR